MTANVFCHYPPHRRSTVFSYIFVHCVPVSRSSSRQSEVSSTLIYQRAYDSEVNHEVQGAWRQARRTSRSFDVVGKVDLDGCPPHFRHELTHAPAASPVLPLAVIADALFSHFQRC
ncbi:uncharacterized protein SCHCODRAFT_02642446, partial [Schizophyllum commune H4-8]|uniref:uncharacterized protein n=1 Tax=Schizophyllum commune (strain H4-8 / FGSC 9210) TaxID=578458 RepID=UPI00215F3572